MVSYQKRGLWEAPCNLRSVCTNIQHHLDCPAKYRRLSKAHARFRVSHSVKIQQQPMDIMVSGLSPRCSRLVAFWHQRQHAFCPLGVEAWTDDLQVSQ
jgi:hypothetical protein